MDHMYPAPGTSCTLTTHPGGISGARCHERFWDLNMSTGAQRADPVVVGGDERRAAVEPQLPALRPAVVPHPARQHIAPVSTLAELPHKASEIVLGLGPGTPPVACNTIEKRVDK